MSNLGFFERGNGLTIGEIAALTKAVPADGVPLDRRVTGIAPVDIAGPGDLTFMDSPKFADQFARTRAGVCLAGARFAASAPAGTAVLTAAHPYAAFVGVAQALFPAALRPSSLGGATGTSPDAVVHPTARVEEGVVIEAGAVIGPGAEIGANTIIGPTAVIGASVRIGRDCAIGAGATLIHALVGDRVVLHPGVRIGQDGFGYIPGPRGLRKVPQIGRVIVQDDVEIGANSTIDRGGMRDTVIGEGTKIDNLVQIGHNCVIGRHCIIVSQVGISGSVTVGDGSMFGGQAAVVDNITIGEGSQIAARAGVANDLPPGQRWGGTPAIPFRDWMRFEAIKLKMGRRTPTNKDSE